MENCRAYTLFVHKDDHSQERDRMGLGLPPESKYFWELWKCVSTSMLREVGEQHPITNLYASLDDLGTEFETIPWTEEHRHLLTQLESIPSETVFTSYSGDVLDEDKPILFSAYVPDPEAGHKTRMGIGMPPRLEFWTLLKHFPGYMLCELGSDKPITDLHVPLSHFKVTTFDAVPWTEEYAEMRTTLDLIAGHWHP